MKSEWVFDSGAKRGLPSSGVCGRPGGSANLNKAESISSIDKQERNQTPMSTLIHFIGLDVHKESVTVRSRRSRWPTRPRSVITAELAARGSSADLQTCSLTYRGLATCRALAFPASRPVYASARRQFCETRLSARRQLRAQNGEWKCKRKRQGRSSSKGPPRGLVALRGSFNP